MGIGTVKRQARLALALLREYAPKFAERPGLPPPADHCGATGDRMTDDGRLGVTRPAAPGPAWRAGPTM